MTNPLKLFILAGEPSGDRIGADLVQRLKLRRTVTLTGVGGSELMAQGLNPIFPMEDLAVMGLIDVVKRLPLLLWRVEQTARAIIAANPDIVVLVDAQDFSKLVAKRLKRKGFAKPMILYVAPTVWARAPHRAAKLKPLFDELLAVLPFEPKIMHELGGPLTSYVGHPALAEPVSERRAQTQGLVALLPGSRSGELKRHMPLLRQVAERLSTEASVTGFFIPTLPSLAQRLRDETADWPVAVSIEPDRSRRAALYGDTLLAITVAGTATLELALSTVPTVITYVMDVTQARIYQQLGRPVVGLPNIIIGNKIVPEIVLAVQSLDAVMEPVLALVGNPDARNAQIEAFRGMRALMENGAPPEFRQDPADRVLAHVQAD